MEIVDLAFSGFNVDEVGSSGDLDIFYRAAAKEFRISVNGNTVFREEEFPVIELANALDSWQIDGMMAKRSISVEPVGYVEEAFGISWSNGLWFLRSCQTDVSVPLSEEDLVCGIAEFIERLTIACAHFNIDLRGLFDRLRSQPHR